MERTRLAAKALFHRPVEKRLIASHRPLQPHNLGGKVDRLRSVSVTGLTRTTYSSTRALIRAVAPQLQPGTLRAVSYAGPYVTELVVDSPEAEQVLRTALSAAVAHGARVLPAEFDHRLPLSQSRTDPAVVQRTTNAYVGRMAREIRQSRDLSVATYVHRRYTDLMTAIDEKLGRRTAPVAGGVTP